MLELVVILCILPLIYLLFFDKLYREVSFLFSLFIFAYTLFLFLTLDFNSPEFQWTFSILTYQFGIDNISIFFIL